MKIFYIITVLLFSYSCKTPTGPMLSENKPMKEIKENSSDCPKDGTCEVEVFPNKSLKITEDGNGGMYTEMVDGNNMVVKYTYLRKGPEGTADGNYFEIIQFEIPATANKLIKEKENLADVKMVFGKHGFRMSEYHMVTSGKLVVEKSNSTLSFDLNFQIPETSQVISRIKETVGLD